MATESASSVDVFVKTDSVNGDKLVLRYVTGSAWITLHCDSSGDLVITDNLGNTGKVETTTAP